MRKHWVSDLTAFFENLNKQNNRNSFKKKKHTGMEKKRTKISKEIDYVDQNRYNDHCVAVENGMQLCENNNSINSNLSGEHCCTVEKGRQIFEKNNSVSHDEQRLSRPRFPFKNISSFDIFSGTAIDHDIPPIEADIEEDGVYPRADISLDDKLEHSSNNSQVTKRKKSSIMKTSSYSNRKSHSKKPSVGHNFIQGSNIDKENEGVLLRMRNQESYYDGKDKYQSQLPEVPLYQVYENSRVRRSQFAQKGCEKSIDFSDYDITNDPNQNSIIFPDISLPPVDCNHKFHDRSNTRDEDSESMVLEPNIDNDLIPDNRNFQLFSPDYQRLRWAETEEGMKLIKIRNLSEDIIKWQEAQFELITSEASYYRSLEVLVNKIYKSPYMDCNKERRPLSDQFSPDCDEIISPFIKPVITATQKHHLFSNILEIHIVSGELLKALESRWRENPFIRDLSDILVDFCIEKLKPYVTYLRNQRFQTDTYNKLLNVPEFLNVIRMFENDPDCVMMNLCSFLMLPMQRVLRLKLLMSVVKQRIPKGYPTSGCDEAIEALEKLIKECSDEKMVMEQKEEILLICNRLIIKDKMNVSIGSKPLLKSGQLKVVSNNNNASKLLSNSLIRRNNNRAQLYLFEDLLIIAKQRQLPLCISSSDDREVVVDTCQRADVKFVCMNSQKFNFKLVLSNRMKGSAEYICNSDNLEELNDWKNIFTVDTSKRDGFDFSEAFVIENYTPTSKNELELKKGQILNIIKRIDNDRAIASSGGKQGEIVLSYVQFISTPQPNQELVNEIKNSFYLRKILN